MSSILDALRKVEAEKAARANGAGVAPDASPVSSAPPAGMDLKTAEATLERSRRRRRTRRSTAPWMYLVGGAVGLGLIVTLSVLLALKLAGTGGSSDVRQASLTPPPAQPAAPVAEPSPAPAEPAPSGQTAAPPVAPDQARAPEPDQATAVAPEPAVAAAAAPEPPAPQRAPAPEEAPPTVSVPVPVPQVSAAQPTPPTVVTVQFSTGGGNTVVTPQPAPEPREPVRPLVVEPQSSAPTAEPVKVARAAANVSEPAAPSGQYKRPEKRPVPDDIKKLPILRETERRRYGLEDMQINMLKEPSSNRPYALAIINMEKVYVGERIPGSDATLIAVRGHGIALEIESSGARYYYED